MIPTVKITTITLVCSLILSACAALPTVIKKERKNRGGITDHFADRLFTADSKSMRVLRVYSALVTVTAFMGDFPSSNSDKEVFFARLTNILRHTADLRDCALGEEARSLSERQLCVFFDNQMFEIEKRVYRLAVSALPLREARQLTGQLLRAELAVFRTLLRVSKLALVAGLRSGAIYRDSFQLQMEVIYEAINTSDDVDNAIKTSFENNFRKNPSDLSKWEDAFTAFRNKYPTEALVPAPKFYAQSIGELKRLCDVYIATESKCEDVLSASRVEASLTVTLKPGTTSRLLSKQR